VTGLSTRVKERDVEKHFSAEGKVCLLLLKIEQDNPNELHVRHANGKNLRFGIKEFAMITGLKCIGDPNDFQYPNTSKSSLIQKYFPDLVKSNSVSKARLVKHFL